MRKKLTQTYFVPEWITVEGYESITYTLTSEKGVEYIKENLKKIDYLMYVANGTSLEVEVKSLTNLTNALPQDIEISDGKISLHELNGPNGPAMR